MRPVFRFLALLAALAVGLTGAAPAWAMTSRIKDIASGRDNQLIGYGLIVGLQGTGDGFRASPFTEQSMRAMLQNLGISTQGGQSNAKNTAAVMVTANLPPFASPGSRIDVTVSSLGDATSLRGGTLIMTSLSGADGQIYAVAQGAVIVSGFQAQGQAATVTEGVTTAGRVPGGAIIDGPDLRTLVAGLNNIGVKPDGIIAILQGIKSAGALQAELVLQ
jgi:flagellar P-ring protein precursor FlgI